ncbi:MAG TPA: GAF domain-containing sensor histidine kinase [Candidatus Baltobacteraceae bacterium]|jgi:signal transduction histidine kinase
MNPRLLTTLCITGLIAAFAIDLFTPQLFISAILLDVPIVLSAFAGNRRLTGALVVAGLIANLVAGYINGLQAGGVWDPVALGNRALAALSIILVGWLGLALQRGAEQQGVAIAIAKAVRRERDLREASENIRNSLSEELVERAITREAMWLVSATRVSLYRATTTGSATRFEASKNSKEVVEVTEAPRPEIQSVLARALEAQEPSLLSREDAMGRLVLDSLEIDSAVVVPLIDGGMRYGTLLLSLDRPTTEEDLLSLRAFAEAAVIALGQSRLFDELAKKNDELAQRSEVIRDIVYALSHDLRTPLAAAGLTLRQAREGAYGPMPERYREILDRSVSANDELQRLAETLLLVAQYESGDRTAEHRTIDLDRLVRDVAAQLQPLADSKKLSVDVMTVDAAVSGDSGELRRALVNLFANAVNWSKDGGRVAIQMRSEGRMVRVSVADEGFGVPDEIRDTLFMRVAGAHARGGGTGLGLYIVRRIAEEHGGRVRYEPNVPQGSVFTLELPRIAVSTPVAP